ncbi:uncharacterized protein LOC126656849 [Mercurialis annua]|uniref:uncharacterized protein LOC126656849 n=1 Tax=Mercurialis annua TaxID=3986 RepID=UPI00215F22A0|nr:uncharacterized protein LOC126656849 [Mercurialis annua]
MSFDVVEVASILVWVKFPMLLWEFWNPNSLSAIASFLGKPLFADRCTRERSRLAYARVLIDMKLKGIFPDVVIIEDGEGIQHTQMVEYEWKPVVCEVCNKLGHRNCVTKHVWLAKKDIEEAVNITKGSTVEENKVTEKEIIETVVIPDDTLGPLEEEAIAAVVTPENTPSPHEEDFQLVTNKKKNRNLFKEKGGGGSTQTREIILLSWNIRGLNEPLKQAEVNHLLGKNNVVVAGILETRVRASNKDKVWKNLNMRNWKLIDNYEFSDNGRMCIMYDDSKAKVNPIRFTDQLIHCDINLRGGGGCSFKWTLLYGASCINDRQRMWTELADFARSVDGNWIVQGDFNAVMGDRDRLSGNELDNNHALEMVNGLSSAGLNEMRSSSCWFTWNNNQMDDNRVWRKLDRVLSNGLNEEMQNSYYEVLPCYLSDHSPILMKIQERGDSSIKKNFKFFNYWTSNHEFREIVMDEWNKKVNGFTMYGIVKKLRAISYRLRNLNRKHYSEISQ